MAEVSSLQGLVEALQIDQSRRWRQGEQVPVEAYLEKYPELRSDAGCILDLLSNEMLLREESGEHAQLRMYEERFPELASQLSPLIEVHRALESGGFMDSHATAQATHNQIDRPAAAPGKHKPEIPEHEILGILGQGGMGVVYKARYTKLKRLSAIKMLRAPEFAGPHELQRFRSEAEAVARLQHPNIVQIHTVGEHEGLPYFSLEFVDGGTLAQKLARAPLSNQEAAELVRTLALAIHHAHQQGVIHRDLKPANVLLTAAGVPKISDFGLAKQLFEGASMTQGGDILGTPSYMAPEQARADRKEIGAATDVYALGAILYEILTGQPPFAGESRDEIMLRVVSHEPLPPRRLRPNVARDLETICLKCLRKEPPKRYASAEDLAEDLGRFLAKQPIRARRTAPWERAWKWCRRGPAAAALLILLLVIVTGVPLAGFVYWHAKVRGAIKYYSQVTNRSGFLEGVGQPLSEEQSKERQTTFKFYERGGNVEKVDVVNAAGELTPNHPLVAYIDDPIGEFMPHKLPCRYVFERDAKGRLYKEIAYDRSGVNKCYDFTYDYKNDLGRYVARGFYPVPRTDTGTANVQFKWKENGLIDEIRYRHKDKDEPSRGADGSYGMRFDYEDARFAMPTGVTFLDKDGQKIKNRYGIARMTRRYDADGNLIRVAFFGNEKRVLFKKAYSGLDLKYEAHGNETERTFLDRDDNPTLFEGCAKLRHTYSQGQRIQQAYFDRIDKPGHRDGFAKIAYQYGVHGLLTKLTYLTVDDQPVKQRNACAWFTIEYDREGNKTEKYFDADGTPGHSEGYASCKISALPRADNEGICIKAEYFDANGLPAAVQPGGYYQKQQSYSVAGLPTEEAYFDAQGARMPSKNGGYARCLIRYDDKQQPCEEEYRDVQDHLVRHAVTGYAKTVMSHNESGWRVTASYFDENNQEIDVAVTVIDPGGSASLLQPNDILLRYDGQPMRCTYQLFDSLENFKQDPSATGKRRELLVLRAAGLAGGPFTIHALDVPYELFFHLTLEDRRPFEGELLNAWLKARNKPAKGAVR